MDFESLEEKIWSWGISTPEKIALINKNEIYTYKALFENIWATKIWFEKEFALEKGDSVLLGANKNVHFIFSYFAIHLIGAKVIPLDEQIQTERLDLIINKTNPKLILGFKHDGDFRCCDYDILSTIKTAVVPNQIDFPKFNQVADILFTTGTTGNPKGVLLTHENIASSANNINSYIGNDSNDVELLALPISHSFGLGRIKCVLTIGGTLVLLGSIVNMKRMFRAFEEYKVTGFGMVPASWQYIQKMSGNRLADFSGQLKYIELGSASMPMEDKLRLSQLFPDTRICMHYGLTEASRSTFMEFHSDAMFLDTIGKASPDVDISIRDSLGYEMSIGEEGEICIKGNHVTIGYLDAINNDFFFEDYFRTGDIGNIDNQGYIRLSGRYNEIINVGGKKLSPFEVESKIHEFDPRLESACIGIKDPNGVMGEVVKAFIVRNNSLKSFDDINNFLNTKLESYKVPAVYEWIDKIPKTNSGKIQRQKLK